MTQSKEIGLPVHEKYPPPARVRDGALVQSREDYQELYEKSINDRDGFWSDMADRYVDWMEPYRSVCDEDLAAGRIAWFSGGKLNVSANCLDRHLAERGDKVTWTTRSRSTAPCTTR